MTKIVEPKIIELNGKQFKYTSPSENKLLKKVGAEEVYDEAYDVLESNYKYIEIEKEEGVE